mmetsp:Transcript_19810/g.30597  ORF Transcript_19810/g.30597 Transcript_19810/m.30597 type:complete len:359 (+) Transcript_19810:85-1161(+)
MSLPANPSQAGRMSLTADEMKKMEGPLMALAEMSGGDLRKLMLAFFSFLNRRTDFYVVPNEQDLKAGLPVRMGFREGDAEKLLLGAFRQFPLRRAPPQNHPANPMKTTPTSTRPTQAASKPTAAKETSPTKNKSESETKDKTKGSMPTEKSAPSKKEKKEERKKPEDFIVRYTEEGKQIPIGNGGTTEKYKWTQTLEETSVLIGIPEGTRGKDLNVSLKASLISVRMKTAVSDEKEPQTLVEGKLTEKIRTDESTWSLEGGVLILALDKLQKTWWKTVIDGDEEIDASLVDSTRKIDTYDDSTQATLRRMIFDQSQERQGLPKSDKILGEKKKIPDLPPGVEFVDQEVLQKHTSTKKD